MSLLPLYENIDVFPVGSVSDLDQTIIEVTNDLFPQHVEEFYPEFIFQCFCCSASTKKNVSVFDASNDDVYKEGTMDLTKIYSGLVPRAALEKEGILHQHDCCDNSHITTQQNSSGLLLTALFAHPDCTSLPSIETCLPLLDQCVHVGASEISSTTNQASPTTLYCKSLIIVALGGSPNSNHFFLIEEVKQKRFRVYDNLRGHTWIKRSEIGKKHKVYGFVLRARKRTPSTFSFDPSIYANVAKLTNDDVVKVNTRGHSKATNSQRVKGRMQIGVRLSAYRQGIAAKLNQKKDF